MSDSDKGLQIFGIGGLLFGLGFIVAFSIGLTHEWNVSTVVDVGVLFVCVWIVLINPPLAAASIFLAYEKGYGGNGWAWFTLLFSTIAFLVAMGLPDKLSRPNHKAESEMQPEQSLPRATPEPTQTRIVGLEPRIRSRQASRPEVQPAASKCIVRKQPRTPDMPPECPECGGVLMLNGNCSRCDYSANRD